MSNIVLMGYRGCGKTSLGKTLAKKTWKDFLDIDELIRDRYDGATVADIWEAHGEPAYRATEVEVTREAVGVAPAWSSLWAGAPRCCPTHGPPSPPPRNTKRIYLHCRAAVLAERLAADPHTAAARPALTSGAPPAAADLDEITRVLEERDPVYREVADAVLDVTYLDQAGTLDYIMRTYA